MGESKRRTDRGGPERQPRRTSEGGLARDLMHAAKAHRSQAGDSPEAVIAGVRLAVALGANYVGLFVTRGHVNGQPAYDLTLYDGAGEDPDARLSAFIVSGTDAEVEAVVAEIRRLMPGLEVRDVL